MTELLEGTVLTHIPKIAIIKERDKYYTNEYYTILKDGEFYTGHLTRKKAQELYLKLVDKYSDRL